MIPKIIHYCWLSGDPLGERERDCIESWRTLMPEYEIWLWDMNRFDIHSTPWVEQACALKKWAFASDYIRLYALYHHGGIYMDTDVRLLKSLDPLTEDRAFAGIEFREQWHEDYTKKDPKSTRAIMVSCGVLGAEKGHPIFKDLMEYYHGRNFVKSNGNLDTKVNPIIVAKLLEKYGFRYDPHAHQTLEHGMHIYPHYYFTMTKSYKKDININMNTHAIHLFANTWDEPNHSRYTWFKIHTKQSWHKFWNDVVLGKRGRKKFKK